MQVAGIKSPLDKKMRLEKPKKSETVAGWDSTEAGVYANRQNGDGNSIGDF
jgi:hypothetical protein